MTTKIDPPADAAPASPTAPLRFNLSRRAAVLFATFYLALFAAGYAYFQREQAELRNLNFKQLAAIGELKAGQIRQWRREREADVVRAASDPHLIRAVRRFLGTPGDANLATELQEHLSYQTALGEYSALQLFATNGSLLFDTDAGRGVINPAAHRLIRTALTNEAATVSDFFLNHEQRFQVDTLSALRDADGRPLAVLNLRSDARAFLLPLIEAWPMPTHSAETLLVQREGDTAVILNELRRATNLPSGQRQSLARTNLTAVQAVLGRQGSFTGQDYRGVSVMADLRAIPGSSWFIVCKVDEDEAMIEEHFRASEVVVILSLFLGLGFGVYIFHQRRMRHWRELSAARQRQLEAQEVFRATLYSIGDGIITTDTAGQVRKMNPAAEKISGWSEAEARGKLLGDVLPLVDAPAPDALADAVRTALRENQVVRLLRTLKVNARGGAERPLIATVASVRDKSGMASGAVVVLVDQTLQEAARRALAESEELWRFALEGAGDGVWDWNLATGEVRFSNRWWEMLGCAANQNGTTIEEWRKRVHPEDLSRAEAERKAHFADPKIPYASEHRVQCQDGRWKWILDRGQVMRRDAAGEPLRMIGTHADITGRKQAEQALRQAHEQLARAQRSAGAGIWDWEMPADTLNWSPELFHLFGLDPEKEGASFAAWQRLVHPADLPTTQRSLSEAVRDHQPLVNEYRIVLPGGQIRWLCALGDTQYAANGTALRMSGICLDITGRKEMESALRASEQRFRSYFELPLIGIAISSPEKGWLEVNDQLCHIFGYSREQLRAMTWAQLTHPADLAADEADFNRVLAGEIESYNLEKRYLRADGRVVPCELGVRCVRKPDGKVDYFLALVQDISMRKQAETELRDNRELLHSIINSTPSNIFAFDLQHRFTMVNEAMARFYGRTKQEMIGKTLHDVFPNALADQILATNRQIIATGEPVFVEETVTDKAGQEDRIMATTKFALRDAQGNIIGLAGTATDITERRQMEKVRAFLMEVSHGQTAEKFFDGLARYLAQNLKMDFVCIDRLESDGLTARTLAVWQDGQLAGNRTYALQDAPCGVLAGQASACFPANVRQRFPQNQALQALQAESYIGQTLFDHAGQPLGLIAAIGRQPLVNRSQAEAILRLVGDRAASEMERGETAAALQLSEERFRALFERANDGIFVLSAAGELVSANQAIARMHGYTVEEMRQLRLADLDTPETLQRVPERMGRLLAGEALTFEVEHFHKDGHVFSLEVSASLITHAGENYVQCYHRDITERKQAAAILAARVQLSEYALNHSLDELLTRTLDEAERLTGSTIGFFHFVEADQKTLSLQTWSTNTLQKMCTAEGKGRHYPVDQAGVWADALRERRPLIHNDYASLPQRKGLPPGHAPVLRELVLPILRQEQVVAMLGVGNKPTDYRPQDIASLSQLANLAWEIVVAKRAEESLRESEQRLILALEGGELATWDWNVKTKRILLNQRLASLLDYTMEELGLLGGTWQSLIHPADRAGVKHAAIRHLRGETPAFVSEHRLRHKSGDWVWVLNKGKVLERNPAGRAMRACGTAQDITLRKRAELLQASVFAIARAAISTATLAELFAQIHTVLQTLLPAQCFYIALYDREKDQLSFPYFQDPFDAPTPPGKPGRGLTEYVLRTGQPLLATREITAELIRRGEVELRGADSLEWLGVPLIVNERVIGVMTVQSYEAPTRFNARNLEVLHYVSTQIASAVERKQTEENLRRSRQQLAFAIAGSGVGLWDLSLPAGDMVCNERACEMLGWTLAELSPISHERWAELCHPEDLITSRARLQRHLAGQTGDYECELRLRHRAGHWVWVLDRGRVTERDAQGQPARMTGTHLDITERKRAEAELQRSHERYRQAIESADAIPYRKDYGSDDYVFLGDRIQAITGYGAAEFCPALWQKIILETVFLGEAFGLERAEVVRRAFAGELKTWRTDHRIRTKSGAIRWLSDAAVLLFDAEGKYTGSMGLLQDITERKQVEAALRESAERHAAILQTAMDGFWMVDLEGRLQEVNETYSRMSGYTVAELLTLRVADLEAGDDLEAISARIHTLVTQGEDRFETRHCRKDGSEFDVEVSVQYRLADGRMVAFLRDITARKRAEATLRESEGRFRSVVEGSMIPIFLSLDMKFAYLNPAALKLLGAERPAELLGQPVLSRIHPDYHASITRRGAKIEQGHKGAAPAQEEVYLRMDGTLVTVEATASPIIYQGQPGAVVFVQDVTARKWAEATLRESEDRYRSLVEESPDAIGIYQEGKLAFCNVTAARMLGGQSPGELIGRTFEQIIHPDDMLAVRERLRRRQAGEKDVYPAEARYVRLDGSIVVVEVSAATVNLQGKPGMQFIARDITARREAAEYLAHLHEQNELILRSAAEGIMGLDLQGHHTFVNPSAASMLGYTPEELLGHHSHSLWHHTKPDGRPYPEDECPILTTCQDGRLHRVTNEVFWRKDGTSFPVEYASRTIYEQGRIAGAVVTFTDITVRRRAEALLRLEGAALEAAANAIIITDREGQIEWANGAFTSLTGYTLEEVVGRNPRLLKSGQQDAEFYRNLWATILAGKAWQSEIVNRRKDGELYHEDVMITPLHNDRGEITHFIAVKQDITARKKLEAQYQQSQKMQAFGQLAGGVAHDFNNLLGVMLGNAELALMGDLNDRQREALQEILNNGERASNLTRQLLAFSRRGTHSPRPLDLNDVVTGVNKMLRRILGEDIRLEVRLLPEGAPVHGESGSLELMLLNLVVNSRAAMPDGGLLGLALAHVQFAAPAARAGDYIRLSVSDTGCGIPPEILPRIFEPFFTTKDVGKGTGLGLATVHGIVEQHHGWIEVESAPGQGATFHIYLPRRMDAQPVATLGREIGPARGGNETILVVEDEEALRRVICLALQKLGYRVIEAGSGRAALELWPSCAAEVALVLTDVIMPEGVSGGQLAEQLIARQPGLKVIYMSGYPGDVAGRGLVLREGENFLKKPFIPGSLGNIIRKCLDAAPKS